MIRGHENGAATRWSMTPDAASHSPMQRASFHLRPYFQTSVSNWERARRALVQLRKKSLLRAHLHATKAGCSLDNIARSGTCEVNTIQTIIKDRAGTRRVRKEFLLKLALYIGVRIQQVERRGSNSKCCSLPRDLGRIANDPC